MKIYKANRFLTAIISILFSFSMCACIPIGNFTNAIETLPQENETYSGEIDPFTITENKTIKLNGVTINGTDTNPSPIKIESGVTVNIVLEGENTLTAYVKYKNDGSIDSSSPRCAGIYVQRDATDPDNPVNAILNIYAEAGGKLTVIGGNYGAGIGGVRTGGSNTGIPGIINIHSGTLYVQGGYQAAGIGSGRSSSGNVINIYGGDITAIAGNSGAGIGTGYGTSGGGDGKVGSYNGGIINITGGSIRAAAGKFKDEYSFDDFDIHNTEYFFKNCYEANGYGAGIGGGYGAASGQITIGGNADVTAIGSCGGAGIGAGRGTSKSANYDETCTPMDITIKGNATVLATTPNENRENQKPGSGAAIGGGRGFNDGGTIKILENANVTAVSTNYKNVQDIAYQDNAGSSYAAAIGGSWIVGSIDTSKPELIATPDTVEITPTAIISAVSDGFVPAISFPEGQVSNSLILLKFTDDFFTNNKDVLDNEEIIKFPSKIVAEDLDNSNNKTTFSINKSSASCLVNLPGEKYRLKVLGENDKESIYLSHNVGNVEDSDEDRKNSAIFYNSKDTYDITGLTSPIEQETNIKNGEEDLKIKIRGREGIFEYGSIFHAESVTDSEEITQLNKDLDDEYENILERSHYYDIGVTHRKSDVAGESPEEYEEFKGGSVTISLQIPAGWDKDELLALYVKADEGDDETFNHRVETIYGVDYITFETKHFSKYALFDPDNKTYNPDDKTENPESQPTLPLFPLTGDNYNALVFGLLSIFFKSYLLLSVIYGRNNL